jgi:hypothetical protein
LVWLRTCYSLEFSEPLLEEAAHKSRSWYCEASWSLLGPSSWVVELPQPCVKFSISALKRPPFSRAWIRLHILLTKEQGEAFMVLVVFVIAQPFNIDVLPWKGMNYWNTPLCLLCLSTVVYILDFVSLFREFIFVSSHKTKKDKKQLIAPICPSPLLVAHVDPFTMIDGCCPNSFMNFSIVNLWPYICN